MNVFTGPVRLWGVRGPVSARSGVVDSYLSIELVTIVKGPRGANDQTFTSGRHRREPAGVGVLSAATAFADQVIVDVLDQFARNFLLNDLTPEHADKLLGAPRVDDHFELANRVPRRRGSAVGRVHQARGGIRRLRSVLQTFPGLFDPKWSNALLVELSWFGGVLGESRDLDVLRAGMVQSRWLITDESAQTAILGQLDQRIDAAHERSAIERSTKRYTLLVDDIAAIGSSVLFEARAKCPADEVLSAQLDGARRDVERAADQARGSSNDENLHELRKELKRLECACEVLGLVAGTTALKLARSANLAQKKLGVVHDEAVAHAWLKSVVVAQPELKDSLKEMRAFHKAARRDAKRGWKTSIAGVEESWHEFRG